MAKQSVRSLIKPKALLKKKSSRGSKPGVKRGKYKKKDKTNLGNVADRVKENYIEEPEHIFEEIKVEEPEQVVEKEKELDYVFEEIKSEEPEQTVEEIKAEELEQVFEEVKDKGEKSFEDFVKKNKTISEEKSELDQEFENEEPAPADEDVKNDLNEIIFTGRMLLVFMDFIFPGIVIWLYSFRDKRAKEIKGDDITLTEYQQAQLEATGVPDAMALYIQQYINPVILFFAQYMIMQMSNLKNEITKRFDQ